MTSASDRIPLTQVRDLLHVGQELPFRVLDEHGRLLLNAGQVLYDEGQLEGLVERGAWAERPLVEATRQARAAAAKAAQQAAPLSLFDRWERLLHQFERLARAIAKKEEPGTAAPAFFAALLALVDRDPDVALFLCVRQEDRRFALYPVKHSIQAAVLVLLTARSLAWEADRCASAACAALTMNLSMLDLQATMAEQDTPPTKKQLEQVRAHPQATVSLLRAAGVADEVWLAAVADHHEHVGGGGYPRGDGDVNAEAQLLRAADVFMAKISARSNRLPITPHLAIRQLFQQSAGAPLAMAMVKTLGVYPPGSLVRLHSGEIGVAIRRAAAGPHPLVATLSDKNGKPTGETHRRNSAEAGFAIDGPVDAPNAFARVLPERVYGLIGV